MNIIAKGCSICKEKFIKVWNENEEEWSYKNAIVVDGMIYHATCHADLLRSNQRQAALAEAAVAAVAAAAAAATAASEATSSEFTPSSANGEHLLSEPHTRADQKSLQGIKLDQEMSTPDSDSPHSLKRKIEQDEQEQEQASSKKTILAQDV
ncbi:mRNA 3' end processing factor [Mortierella claussenii]|nr:mRNA 3' end processing factor [Mortierella claussenii]